jgi:nuclear transport factor 2 (NTF2) superfamily protein
MTTKPTDIKPTFDKKKAKLKVKAAENAWNTRNPEGQSEKISKGTS